jgi:hypothetical protein
MIEIYPVFFFSHSVELKFVISEVIWGTGGGGRRRSSFALALGSKAGGAIDLDDKSDHGV